MTKKKGPRATGLNTWMDGLPMPARVVIATGLLGLVGYMVYGQQHYMTTTVEAQGKTITALTETVATKAQVADVDGHIQALAGVLGQICVEGAMQITMNIKDMRSRIETFDRLSQKCNTPGTQKPW